MIARRGDRTVTDMGPCPAGVEALNAYAYALGDTTWGSEIERRPATPEELARLDGDPEPEPVRLLVRTPEQLDESRRRGGAATAVTRSKPRRTEMGRPRLYSDAEMLLALRECLGNQSRAARLLGMSKGGWLRRMRRMRDAGLPADIEASLRRPGGLYGWERAA